MFATPLCLQALDQVDLWYLTAPLHYRMRSGELIVVPAGFITDLASVPHAVDWIPFLNRTGRSRRPAGLHDWAYAALRWRGKDWCDALLREALVAEGLSEAQATVYFKAVQWFGGSAWDFDGNRHPYDVNTANLEATDFIDQASWQAWIATCPTPNENNRDDHVAVPPAS